MQNKETDELELIIVENTNEETVENDLVFIDPELVEDILKETQRKENESDSPN